MKGMGSGKVPTWVKVVAQYLSVRRAMVEDENPQTDQISTMDRRLDIFLFRS